jgi:1,4-dihydroxy-2-naphthoyl-CoA synthase
VTGVTYLGVAGLGLYYNTEEAAEGVKAFQEKRKPRFEDYRKVAI